jgi:hypothetical protein
VTRHSHYRNNQTRQSLRISSDAMRGSHAAQSLSAAGNSAIG